MTPPIEPTARRTSHSLSTRLIRRPFQLPHQPERKSIGNVRLQRADIVPGSQGSHSVLWTEAVRSFQYQTEKSSLCETSTVALNQVNFPVPPENVHNPTASEQWPNAALLPGPGGSRMTSLPAAENSWSGCRIEDRRVDCDRLDVRESVMVQKDPARPSNPEHSFVTCTSPAAWRGLLIPMPGPLLRRMPGYGRRRRRTSSGRTRAWACRNPPPVAARGGCQRASTETPKDHAPQCDNRELHKHTPSALPPVCPSHF